MEKKLGLKPILTQVPLENGQLIDLINLERITFDSKGNVEKNKIGLNETVSLHSPQICLSWPGYFWLFIIKIESHPFYPIICA